MSTIGSMLPWAALSIPAIIVIAYGIIQYRRAGREAYILECDLGVASISGDQQTDAGRQPSVPIEETGAVFRSRRSQPAPRPISRSEAVRMHRQHRVTSRVRSRPSGFAV